MQFLHLRYSIIMNYFPYVKWYTFACYNVSTWTFTSFQTNVSYVVWYRHRSRSNIKRLISRMPFELQLHSEQYSGQWSWWSINPCSFRNTGLLLSFDRYSSRDTLNGSVWNAFAKHRFLTTERDWFISYFAEIYGFVGSLFFFYSVFRFVRNERGSLIT